MFVMELILLVVVMIVMTQLQTVLEKQHLPVQKLSEFALVL